MSRFSFRLSILAIAVTSAIAQPDAAPQASTVSIENGVVSFQVKTNVPALEVSGKSAALRGRLQMSHEPGGLKLERIEASVAAATLKTGMALRDEHMRKRIFTSTAGELADLRFESGLAVCPVVVPGHDSSCVVSGNLSIRGAAHAFSIPLKIRQEPGGAFRVSGDGIVKLSDYGIEAPSQLGVRTANEVGIHLELTAKDAGLMAAASGRR